MIKDRIQLNGKHSWYLDVLMTATSRRRCEGCTNCALMSQDVQRKCAVSVIARVLRYHSRTKRARYHFEVVDPLRGRVRYTLFKLANRTKEMFHIHQRELAAIKGGADQYYKRSKVSFGGLF